MKLPELTTERLLLRQLRKQDAEAICKLRTDKEVNTFLERPKTFTQQESRTFIKNINAGIRESKSYYWAISIKLHPELIGTICIWNISDDKTSAEIGYELFPSSQGKGFMNEAIERVIQFCFSKTRIIKLWAATHVKNRASAKLLEKNLFKFHAGMKNENPDLQFYSLDKSNS